LKLAGSKASAQTLSHLRHPVVQDTCPVVLL